MVAVGIGVSDGSSVALGSGNAVGAAQPKSELAARINIQMISKLRVVIGFILPRIFLCSLDYLVLNVLLFSPVSDRARNLTAGLHFSKIF
jgi:hypothetical protein